MQTGRRSCLEAARTNQRVLAKLRKRGESPGEAAEEEQGEQGEETMRRERRRGKGKAERGKGRERGWDSRPWGRHARGRRTEQKG